MSEVSWTEFPEVSPKQWKQKIQADLKGLDYNEVLIWKTNEDIAVRPFYTYEDAVGLPAPVNNTAGWKICQKIYAATPKKARATAVEALQRGAESILFIIPSEKITAKELLEHSTLTAVPIYIQPNFLNLDFIKQLQSFSKEKKAQIHLNIDSIGHLARHGNWHFNLQKDRELLEKMITHAKGFKTILSINASLYQNAGATMVQQIAYALAHANEYLNHLSHKNLLSEAFENATLQFNIAVSANYFFEIAKIRALRLLWKTLAQEYNIASDCHIFAQPTIRNKTLYDYNVNMLRTTTEMMSAILGGANTICNLPYDAIYHKNNEFGERIARNQLLILKHESYFDKVSNSAEGSYYIENITAQLAESALEIFKQIEAGGGFLAQLKTHTIQRKIKQSAALEQQQFDEAAQVLVGTNKYPNKNDKMKQDLDIYPFVKINTRKTFIEPITERRLSDKAEQERLKNE